jgi:hypothetical protein
MQVMLEAGENFLKVEQVEGADSQPDLLITMDRTKVNPSMNEKIEKDISQGFGSGSVFNQVNGSGSVFGIWIRIRIQESKNYPQK